MMNRICKLFIGIFLLFPNVTQAQTSAAKTYGEPFKYDKSISVADLKEVMNDQDSLMATFSGTIETSCQAKGCWMTLNTDDGNSLRVTFKDYSFFVPTEGLSGKKATFVGYCQKSETSVAELQHYAEDAGQTADQIAAITAPKLEYKFVASGVIIQD